MLKTVGQRGQDDHDVGNAQHNHQVIEHVPHWSKFGQKLSLQLNTGWYSFQPV